MIDFTHEHKRPKSTEEIENLKGLRIFSYLKQLQNRINPEGDEKFRSATFLKKSRKCEDENQDVDKAQQSLGVTDMKNEKDMIKTFGG